MLTIGQVRNETRTRLISMKNKAECDIKACILQTTFGDSFMTDTLSQAISLNPWPSFSRKSSQYLTQIPYWQPDKFGMKPGSVWYPWKTRTSVTSRDVFFKPHFGSGILVISTQPQHLILIEVPPAGIQTQNLPSATQSTLPLSYTPLWYQGVDCFTKTALNLFIYHY